MSETLPRWLVRAVLCTSAFAAQAQGTPSPATPAARPDPLDPGADVPASSYSSSLSRYRAPVDDKPVSWREANDAAARFGGWRAYAREARQPDAARPVPMPPGHAGHESRGRP